MKDFNTGNAAVEESSTHYEDGVGMYSDVRGHQNTHCWICFQEHVETREFALTEFYEAGKLDTYRQVAMDICIGCLARAISAPVDAVFHNGVRET